MSRARKPPALAAGDVIGIATPAGPISEDRLARGVAELQGLGFRVRVAAGVLERKGFTAGGVEARLGQLHALLRDPEVRAIAYARGGAGTLHLLPQLDLELVRAHPKLVLGYSDATALHLVLSRLGHTSLHGPMVTRELADGEPAYDRASLWHALTGQGEPWASGDGELAALRPGAAEGTLRGGCLSLLAASVGTPWSLRTGDEPTLLFVEDVDEPPYRIDRMLRQLRLCGALDGVRGIVLGAMNGCQAAPEAGYTLDQIVIEALDGLELPVATGLSSGHTNAPNVTLPLGVQARLECEGGFARLTVQEAAVR